ncbi:Non-specific protein-tyrosine kinase [Aphelenchoides besseyi]|nr:Non-specific protein-tyrosine kinase [Aphelenchoides besseyi]KAI6219754.1 Non-specific protein-tyrosine kinase [Aphelenchoides besseyi]
MAQRPVGCEKAPFYHGILPPSSDDLKNEGDFLVHAIIPNLRTDLQLVLRVRCKTEVAIVPLTKIVGDRYCLQSELNIPGCLDFATVEDLIKYFHQNPLPNGQKLVNPIGRPKWLLYHSTISYNEVDKLGSGELTTTHKSTNTLVGNFSDVYRGTYWKKTEARPVAVKVCHEFNFRNDKEEEQAMESLQMMLHEAKLMSRYKHKHVVTLVGIACDHIPIMVLMELCCCSLEDHCRRFPSISPFELTLYALESARGMRYLHKEECVHRDLATRNCLIASDGRLKIADFGLSKVMKAGSGEIAIRHVPIRWMAPETLRKKPKYSFQSDVWSFGMFIFEIFNAGEMPWPGSTDFKDLARRIKTLHMPQFPNSTPTVVKDLVLKRIWILEPEERANFDEIVKTLTDFMNAHEAQLPELNDFYLNRIQGVTRKYTLHDKTKLERNDEQTEQMNPVVRSRSTRTKKKRKPASARRRPSASPSIQSGKISSPDQSDKKRSTKRKKVTTTQSVSREE